MLNLSNRVQNRRMMAAVVEFADLDHTPPTDMLGQIHRNLPTKAGTLLISGDSTGPKLAGDGGLDLLQGGPPESCPFVSSAHPTPLAAIRHELDQSTSRCRRDRSPPGIRATWFAPGPTSPPASLGTSGGAHSRCSRVGSPGRSPQRAEPVPYPVR